MTIHNWHRRCCDGLTRRGLPRGGTLGICGFSGIGLIAWLPFWLTQPAGPICAVNCDLIQLDMSQEEVEQILGGPGEASSGDGHGFCVVWQGRGRKEILVSFSWRRGNEYVTSFVSSKLFFNPSLWDRFNEWWGGYELHPDGTKSKRIEGA